jgi:hypothetical protein
MRIMRALTPLSHCYTNLGRIESVLDRLKLIMQNGGCFCGMLQDGQDTRMRLQ